MRTKDWICVRVSTREQARGGFSLDAQEKRCREVSGATGGRVCHVFRWDESAKGARREKLDAMIERIRSLPSLERPDRIIFPEVDRLARDERVFYATEGELRDLGVKVTYADAPTDGEGSRILKAVKVGLAAEDNDRRARKTLAGMREAASQGRWIHRPPLGYVTTAVEFHERRRWKRTDQESRSDRPPSMVPDPERAPLIRLAFELWAAACTTPQVQEELSARGLRSAAGRRVATQTLFRIRSNRSYYGLCEYPRWGIQTLGDWKPIVSEDLWAAAQPKARLGLRSYRRTREDLPLKGLVFCASCGRPMTGEVVKGGNAYYKCRRGPQSGCAQPARSRVASLDAQFRALLDSVRFPEGLATLYAEAVRVLWAREHEKVRTERTQLSRRLSSLEDEAKTLLRKVATGVLSDDEMRSTLDEIQGERHAVREKLAGLDAVIEEGAELAGDLRILEEPAEVWQSLPARQKVEFGLELFPSGIQFDGEKILTPQVAALIQVGEAFRGREAVWHPQAR